MKVYFKRMASKGVCPPRKPLKKILWSWVGAMVGILLITVISNLALPYGVGSALLIGSFGATAVILYGAPMAEFSQPRNLLGGHFFSALLGVSIFILLGEESLFAAPLAVSLSIVVMHFTRTLHPPGGATALIAIIGGESVHNLGYMYAFYPVLVGALLMLLVALSVNNMSRNPKWHYPVYWF
ncbi:HPP family protein [Pseudoalteromonas sp. OANN1]|uniref:HPP family protein n=1 Tax=Pseudoalteromonas sp. OANN1 TaxID=2954497 RepID=UPI00209748C8|nr:HPP family protein [Pseudoalteromonas sp. OANN1]MCO7198522.1 HPP family protein [Pseudoalteromonas sp. OANN1]